MKPIDNKNILSENPQISTPLHEIPGIQYGIMIFGVFLFGLIIL